MYVCGVIIQVIVTVKKILIIYKNKKRGWREENYIKEELIVFSPSLKS